ncbi:helix-turn-helix transcriptional regulator [Streptomyces sp. NPDC048484]|uniref:helix-turn-helix domain-containing protein n=1 Tax=Streptomyces sp. NPDC048484 TaxID=3155146 RepID=UPI00343B7033
MPTLVIHRFDPARLRGLRVARGWSQSELARRSGIVRPAISNYEAGKREPTDRVLETLATALDFEADDLRQQVKVSV